MEITREALRRIEQLRAAQHKPKWTGLRLGFTHGHAFIKWETRKPRRSDVVMVNHELPVVVDQASCSKLQDYALDIEVERNKRAHFILRHFRREQQSFS